MIGDGCTDATLELAHREGAGRVTVQALPQRAGKAAALNAGLELATGEIIVFTDAGILLDAGALAALVGHFANKSVGCVSGEDYIEGGGTEGLYGRLELLLRREEARLHSIAGASGCFYGMRKSLCRPFRPGMAPDFLSVLDTVRSGHRALCEPKARGVMTATASTSAEYSRKTRTLLRGMTALFGNAALLNPLRFPAFSFVLVSHKLLRWLAPLALAGCLVAALLLRGRVLYETALYGQVALYTLALAGLAHAGARGAFDDHPAQHLLPAGQSGSSQGARAVVRRCPPGIVGTDAEASVTAARAAARSVSFTCATRPGWTDRDARSSKPPRASTVRASIITSVRWWRIRRRAIR